MKKNVVILSRVIFPKIAPRPMRATELAKEFARQGHNVTLYALLGKYDYSDFEKETGVKVKSLGKTRFAKINSDDTYTVTIIDKILKKIFGRFLEFPDIELANNVFKVLKKEDNIDLLISVAIPYPIHWGVAWHKSKFPNKYKETIWVADCGDPYMGNPFHKKMPYFKFVEKWFCKKANFISIPIEEAKQAYYAEFRDKIRIIPQGFDFSSAHIDIGEIKNEIPTFIYAGVFYPNVRDPRPLLQYLCELDLDFRFYIYTKSVSLISKYKEILKEKLIINDYIPREELLLVMKKSDFVINLENNSALQSPSKLIDYALSGRPILSLNSNNELEKDKVLSFLKGDYQLKLSISDIDRYDIKNVTKDFMELIK